VICANSSVTAHDDELLKGRLSSNSIDSSKMMGKSEPDWGCPTRLCPFVRTPARIGNEDDPDPSTGTRGFGGGTGKPSRTVMSSSPKVGDRLAAGLCHAGGAESEEEDELSCGSDELPSTEADKSLIKSGVPVSEGSGVDNSVMGENWHALPTHSGAVLSIS